MQTSYTMRKAVLSSVKLLLIFATLSVFAQQDPSVLAEQVAVRRQAAIHEMRLKLADAIDAQNKGRLEEAAKIYDQIVELFPQTGPSTELIGKEKQEIIAGLASVRLALARDAQKHGDLQEAKRQVDRVLKVDPKNEIAKAFARGNDKEIRAQRGTIPDADTLAIVPIVQNEKINASTLAHDGQLLFEMGKLEQAEIKLREAKKLDSENAAARYYLNLIEERRFRRATADHELLEKQKIVDVAKEWLEPTKRELLPIPNMMARTNIVYSNKGRQDILSKLEHIRLNQVNYDSLPLGEVLKLLTDESIQRDPDKIGLNLMIDAHMQGPSSVPISAGNPADAAAAAAAAAAGVATEAGAAPIDIANIPIKLSLRNVRLADVLDAITKVAEPQLTYRIEEYAVVLSPKPTEVQQLFSKTFRIDPNTFVQGLESVIALSFSDIGSGGSGGSSGGGGGSSGGRGAAFSIPRVTLATIVGGNGGGATTGTGQGLPFVSKTNHTAGISQLARDYFLAAGVDLNPPKYIFFNDRLGQLLVRATQQELETIAAAIDTLNAAPPQLTIEAKIAEIAQEDSRALGFDWFLGNTLLNHGTIGAATGTQPSFSGHPTVANPSGIFPGPGSGSFPGPGTIPQAASDNLLVPGAGRVNSQTPAIATITGVLTDPQFRVVIRALETRQGVDLLTAPRVTTLSGRQAQISSLDLVTVVTGVDLQQGSNPQTTGGGNNNNNTIVVSAPTLNFTTEPLPFGPVLDVIPYVSADGFSVQMTLIPTITEFLGYDDPGGFIPQASSSVSQGISLTAQLPLPRLRLRQVTTSCNVWDGQTVVLGGLISENVNKVKDKIPMLGDLPLVGKLFRSESSTSTKKNLVIFVTPTIIDPAGNRVHTDEELPFARNSLPTQAEGVQAPPVR